MPTNTTTYSFQKPVVGADEDSWGGYLNSNWDKVDDLFDGTSAITGIDINGGTIDGTVIGGTTAAAITGTTITGTSFVSSGNMTFGDNDKAIFGAGSDLQIYHDGASGSSYISEIGSGNLYIQGSNLILEDANGENFLYGTQDGDVRVYHNGAVKLATTSTGIDVTGTVTADGLTVDGSVGIGTSSPASIVGGTDTNPVLSIGGADGVLTTGDKAGSISFITSDGSYTGTYSDGVTAEIASVTHQSVTGAAYALAFYTGTITGSNRGERMRIDSSGNVGIGTSLPANVLEINKESSGTVAAEITNTHATGSGSARLILNNGSDTNGNGFHIINNANDGTVNLLNYKNTPLAFWTNASERMRIDSSGNVLIGRTDVGLDTESIVLRERGEAYFTADGLAPMVVNRLTSDGSIVSIRKGGSQVGSIGNSGTAMYIGSDSGSDAYLLFTNNRVQPCTSTGADRDNIIDLGITSARFDDIYATNGTIQTSDEREKQDIDVLSEAEHNVAVACKGLLRKFRWKDAVAEKGDDARIHFGIIAQDLKAAFEAEGLDAGDYAMFIHSTWTDEETGEERDRMGVRYPELLAFIIAAI